MTIKLAKSLTWDWLFDLGLNNKVTARTVSFSDLARAECIFVTIHNWKTNPAAANTLCSNARAKGFRIQFK